MHFSIFLVILKSSRPIFCENYPLCIKRYGKLHYSMSRALDVADAKLSCDGVLITFIILCYSAGKGVPTGLSFELVNPKHLDEAEKQLLEVRPLYSSKCIYFLYRSTLKDGSHP